MLYPPVALERAMTIREVVLRAMSGEITWIQAAEIIGCTPRSVRRWLGRFARDGYFGLLDRRRGQPSPRRAPFADVQRSCGSIASSMPASTPGTSTRSRAASTA